MDLNLFALIVTACASSGIALAALSRAPDRPSSRIFVFNSVCVTVWAGLTYRMVTATDPQEAGLLLRLVHPVSALAVASFVDFMWVFPERLQPINWRRRAALYGGTILFSSVVALPQFVRSLELTPRGPQVAFGWPLIVFALYVVPMVVHVNFVLWHKVRTLHGIARVQIVYVLAGTLSFGLLVLFTNIILPIVTGHTAYSRWGVVGYLFTGIAIGTAIAKHRLWDLGSLGRRAAAATLAVGSLTLLAAGAISLAAQRLYARDPTYTAVLWTLVGAGFGIALPPVYNAFRGLLSRFLGEERERISKLLSSLGAAVVHAPVGGAALTPMLAETLNFFQANSVTAYLKGTDDAYHNGGTIETDPDPKIATHLGEPLPQSVVAELGLTHLSESLDMAELKRFGSVEETVRKVAAMDHLGAHVVTPLRWQDDTIGLLALGPKLSRDMYSTSDLDLLRDIAAHAAIALKNAELRAEMLAEKERTEKVLAQMESGVVAADPLGVIRLVNRAACSLLSMREDELVGRHLRVLPPPLRSYLRAASDEGAIASGKRVVLSAPSYLPLDCSAFVLPGIGGSVEGAAIVFRDIRIEEDLQRSRREMERLQLLRAVSAGMAHEIRNPLVAIRTFAELAPSRLDDPEFRSTFLEVAHAEVLRLEELVSQFMTLAKPSREVREAMDLNALMTEAVTTASARAQTEEVELLLDLPDDLPRPTGDETRLHQAIMNLLHNALDAAPAGHRVQLRAVVEGNGHAGEDAVAITVWNSGSYIPPEDRARVFEPFFSGKRTGTGLGLAICQTIVDEHGGTTSVESDTEAGTAFTIRLPVTTAHELAPA